MLVRVVPLLKGRGMGYLSQEKSIESRIIDYVQKNLGLHKNSCRTVGLLKKKLDVALPFQRVFKTEKVHCSSTATCKIIHALVLTLMELSGRP